MAALAQPPRILQICREPLKPGMEAAYHAIEEDTARLAAGLGCPHPYLALESLTGSREVWWLNGYESPDEQTQVYEEYAKNARLMAALQQNSRKKASFTNEPIEVLTRYRQDLSVGTPWILGRGRFVVTAVTKGQHQITGTVFEAPDGTRYILISAQTGQEADAACAIAGAESYVFAIRPSWSFPAEEWIASDPSFWL